MKNIFEKEIVKEVIARIENLTAETKPNWGKMNVQQMLAHLCVPYEMVYTQKHAKPNALVKLFLKLFIKKAVVSEKPFSKNGKTSAQFKITDERFFEEEKQRLIGALIKTQELGTSEFEGKVSDSFGALTAKEWNTLFYKHLDHHLTQFGV
ncbi:DUF1569 domain-containing protein [uncultured Polaribacter sp.]|uniref:DUF1569 domain-containing protein n=1 Tax=uncultured Polaribacter sp. TaxID=174711 RepID=UPI002611DFBE|nr:DUF1569 domain-containing protein [uncultured Polaribacter sp.]